VLVFLINTAKSLLKLLIKLEVFAGALTLLKFVLPLTCNLDPGLVNPIPTLPELAALPIVNLVLAAEPPAPNLKLI